MRTHNALKKSVADTESLTRSGVFSTERSRTSDGVIGRTEFVASWSGMGDIECITDHVPPPAILMPNWFVYSPPYHWN